MSTLTVPAGIPVRPRVWPAAALTPAAKAARRKADGSPVRLTRRGRLLVTLLVGLALAAMAVVLTGSPTATPGMEGGGLSATAYERVTVQPGQTLWALALEVDPTADPRVVVQEIMELNALNSAGVRAGQVLLLPR